MAVKKAKAEEKKETEAKKTEQVVNKRKPSKKYGLVIFILLILFIVGLWIYLHLGWFVVASVNGKLIWRTDLIRELEKQSGKQMVDFLVNRSLIYQEAAKKNVNVTEEEIKAELDKYDQQLKAQGSSLADALSLQGLNEDSFKDELKYELTVRKLLADKINVTDEEIKQYYEQNKSQFGKDQTLEGLKDTIKQLLSNQKLSLNYSSFIQDLKSAAKLRYFSN
ncbi:MAG: hypothetical protein KatS3mg088_549 [Patescibacteria group bacterium]|nr:MAG: hypothetical protein KatS3mg088_549 [Patescibacteria group bacterium]